MRGDEGDYHFQNQETIKVYESLLGNPGVFVRPQGTTGLGTSPVENRHFIFKSSMSSRKTRPSLIQILEQKHSLEFILFQFIHAIALSPHISLV